MKIPISFGGGSSGSDDVTATAAQVLSPYTAITSESEDEPQMGTMADYAGTTQAASGSLDTSNNRYQLTIPNDGRYTTGSKVYQTYADARTTIGYTDASKVLSGTTYLGLAGTMADRSGTTSSATSSLDSSNSRVRLQIPSNGYYNTSAYLYNTYSNIASLIGLTAAKIKYGETILGITGTWNGYVATATDIYYGGSVGSLAGSMSVYSDGMITASAQSACIRIVNAGGENNQYYGGASFSSAINLAGYSKITMTFNMTQTASNSGTTYMRCIGIGLFSSRPTSGSALNLSTAFRYVTSTALNSSSTQTLTIDVSDISSSYYIGVCGANNLTGATWTAEITRIQLS